jgi:hypothetical protein
MVMAASQSRPHLPGLAGYMSGDRLQRYISYIMGIEYSLQEVSKTYAEFYQGNSFGKGLKRYLRCAKVWWKIYFEDKYGIQQFDKKSFL